jgi:hypothetical protein
MTKPGFLFRRGEGEILTKGLNNLLREENGKVARYICGHGNPFQNKRGG